MEKQRELPPFSAYELSALGVPFNRKGRVIRHLITKLICVTPDTGLNARSEEREQLDGWH